MASSADGAFSLTCGCQPDLPQMNPCRLIIDRHSKRAVRQELRVECAPWGQKACLVYGCDAKVLFGAAWSILLKYFAGMQEVTFALLTVDAGWRQGVGGVLHGIVNREDSTGELIAKVQRSFDEMKCSCPLGAPEGSQLWSQTWDTAVYIRNPPEIAGDRSVEDQHSIVLQVYQGNGCYEYILSYDESKICPDRAKNIAATLVKILKSMLTGPGCFIKDVDCYGDNQLLAFDTRQRNTPVPSSKFLHEMMELHAATNAWDEAVCSWDVRLSYGELRELSTNLADHLRQYGVGVGMIVPILAEKSGFVPVAILGILKTGAAFLPLDVSHPPERLASTIARVNAKVAIVSKCPASIEQVVFPTIACRVHTSSFAHLPKPPPDSVPLRMSNNTIPAYVLFTSGSTGTPKGVVIDHSAIVTSSFAFGRAAQMSSKSRVIQFSSHAFDVCILELCTTLLFGGTVCIPSEEQRMNNIEQVMEDMEVNSAFITPTVARLIEPKSVPSLKNLLLCGEPVQADNLGRWVPVLKHFFIGYGPAETSVLCSVERVSSAYADPRNVGAPTGSSAWIVNQDDDTLLCPDGTAGEVVMMGPVVSAIGYLNDPEKTAASFIKNPAWLKHHHHFSQKDRFYKTGDSGFLDHGGNLWILGRIDNQIKLHGQRIELGEIEINLRKLFPTYANIVVEVISPGGNDRNKQLAAFVVRGYSGEPKQFVPSLLLVPRLNEIRDSILERLPHYMCPSVYIPLYEMPTTANSKVDRKALRALGSGKSLEQIAAYNGIQRPAIDYSATEEQKFTNEQFLLIIFWSKILGIGPTKIRLDDSFFVLGGDSIKAILLVRLALQNDQSLKYEDIFANPTLAAMASVMQFVGEKAEVKLVIDPFSMIDSETKTLVLTKLEAVGIAEEDVEDMYPSTAEQDRMIRQTIVHPGSHVINFPYKLGPDIDADDFQRACEFMVEAFPILRTRFISLTDSTSIQVVMKEQIQWQILKNGPEEFTPLSVDFGKPMTCWAITSGKVSENNRYAVWSIHHNFLDGWSFQLFWDALEYAYRQKKSPEVLAEFKSLIKYYSTRDHSETEKFWRDELKDAPPAKFFADFPPGYIPFQTKKDERSVTWLSTPNIPNITISTVLQLAYAMSMGSMSMKLEKGEEMMDFVFRTTGSGRTQPVSEIDNIIGAVLTSYPIRIKYGSSESVRDTLQRVQSQIVAIGKHEYLGIEHIKTLADNSNGIVCDSDSPYLIIQTQAIKNEAFEGLTKIPFKLPNSRTPFSVCCILREGGMKIHTGYDEMLISPDTVDTLLKLFEKMVLAVCEGYEGDWTMEKASSIAFCPQ